MKKITKKLSKVSLMAIWLIIWSIFQSFALIIISFSLLIIIIFEKYIWIKLPVYFTVTFILFMIFSIILWDFGKFYEKFLWWDDMLHFFYWVGFSIIWYIIIYRFALKQGVKELYKIILTFSFCFTLAFWVIWEIFEFSMDQFLWLNMQRIEIWTWVTDTMSDLILATLASLATNIYIYLYLKFWMNNWISVITEDFKKLNVFHKVWSKNIKKTQK